MGGERVKILILGIVIVVGIVAYLSLKSLGENGGKNRSETQGCSCNCATCSEGCKGTDSTGKK